MISGSVKSSLKSLFIFNTSQYLFPAFFMSGNVRLYGVNGVLFEFAWFSQFSSCVIAMVIVFKISY